MPVMEPSGVWMLVHILTSELCFQVWRDPGASILISPMFIIKCFLFVELAGNSWACVFLVAIVFVEPNIGNFDTESPDVC